MRSERNESMNSARLTSLILSYMMGRKRSSADFLSAAVPPVILLGLSGGEEKKIDQLTIMCRTRGDGGQDGGSGN